MGKAVVDARPIALNLCALQLPNPERIPAEKVPAGTVLVGQTVDVILPGQGRPITLKVEKVEQIVDGVVTYSGALEANPEAFFSFSVEGDKMLGRILIGDASVIVRPGRVASGHELIIVDRALLPVDDDTIPFDAEPVSAAGTETFSTAGASSTGSGDVRTLFLFANNVSHPSTLTAAIISEFNNALSRSGVSTGNKLSSAGIIIVDSGFTGSDDCKGGILNDMFNRSAPFSNIDQWMNDNAADIAFLVVQAGPSSVVCPFRLRKTPWEVEGRIGGISTGFFRGNSSTIPQPVPSRYRPILMPWGI